MEGHSNSGEKIKGEREREREIDGSGKGQGEGFQERQRERDLSGEVVREKHIQDQGFYKWCLGEIGGVKATNNMCEIGWLVVVIVCVRQGAVRGLNERDRGGGYVQVEEQGREEDKEGVN